MMKQIELVTAKANLSKIVDRIHRTGEPVTLTKRGEPCVDVVPHRNWGGGSRSKSEVLNQLDKLRKGLPKSAFEQIKGEIAEGRH